MHVSITLLFFNAMLASAVASTAVEAGTELVHTLEIQALASAGSSKLKEISCTMLIWIHLLNLLTFILQYMLLGRAARWSRRVPGDDHLVTTI